MDYRFELRATQALPMYDGGFWEASLAADDAVISTGCRTFRPDTLLPAGNCLASFGESITISNLDSVVFQITTDTILDPGHLARSVTLAWCQAGGSWRSIPLSSPCVRMDWPSRGLFCITLPTDVSAS